MQMWCCQVTHNKGMALVHLLDTRDLDMEGHSMAPHLEVHTLPYCYQRL